MLSVVTVQCFQCLNQTLIDETRTIPSKQFKDPFSPRGTMDCHFQQFLNSYYVPPAYVMVAIILIAVILAIILPGLLSGFLALTALMTLICTRRYRGASPNDVAEDEIVSGETTDV